MIYLLAILPAILLHELAHGYVADRFEDFTPRNAGRLTLNPLPHFDALGTVAIPIFTWLTTGFVFGWAKAIPINFAALRREERRLVLLAGPACNVAQAFCWALIYALGGDTELVDIGIRVNLVMALVNLFPIPPLDGGRALALTWPELNRLEPYGIAIVIVLIAVFDRVF